MRSNKVKRKILSVLLSIGLLAAVSFPVTASAKTTGKPFCRTLDEAEAYLIFGIESPYGMMVCYRH